MLVKYLNWINCIVHMEVLWWCRCWSGLWARSRKMFWWVFIII